MINVGFIINYRLSGWLGVSNYYKNFLNSINNIKNSKIKPIIITDYHFTKNEKLFFKGVKIIKTHLVDRKSRGKKIINNLLISIFGRNIFLDNFLKKNNINIISHTSYLGKNSNIISLKWFPDFQEIHLPELFNSKQILARSYDIKMAAKHSTKIIISSTSVKNDLKKINNQAYEKGLIFKHVNEIIKPEKLKNYHYLKKKYSLKKKYFFLPNHFWKHKNHIVVLKALNQIKKKLNFDIISSGNITDYRFPNHFEYLKNYIKEKKLENYFRILGVVPFEDVLCLMKYSVGVINPSLSEGWSNTVDQANCYGRKIILSDIKVHKEQKPFRGVYFKKHNHKDLASKLIKVSSLKIKQKAEKMHILKAYNDSKLKRKKYAENYQNFIIKISH
ncbi:glycosyltransferase involved in cell wall biosynthesis [Candidatus Pelagibacter ubique]|uniref:Glycosyltransferase involved in cell wall biosynthesis n=1 Tax=Pelagibacter ubique TaxID=198252 RepID=A0ABX1T1Z0_PELUQ|nr:glycosyltransferase [Candidatus Pelagibacter ubique]NMN67068.1 glycosyltransferase involved in cell wall biosynthesis [Candidatus Pelagibacter ubique]